MGMELFVTDQWFWHIAIHGNYITVQFPKGSMYVINVIIPVASVLLIYLLPLKGKTLRTVSEKEEGYRLAEPEMETQN